MLDDFEQRVKFDERGLAPCVAQDHASGEVLTLAYLSEESLRLTVETGTKVDRSAAAATKDLLDRLGIE